MQPDPGAGYQRINAQRLHEVVVQQIVHQILRGELRPGAALPTEPELSQLFGVSRTVIREAVRVLVAKGLVTAKHGSGVWVQPEEHWDYLDPLILLGQIQSKRNAQVFDEVLEVRRIVEVEIVALAATRRSDEDLQALQRAAREMRAAVSDPDAYTTQDVLFHDRILRAARNRLLQQTLRPISQALEVARRISIRRPQAAQLSFQGHEEILAAIQDADAGWARDAMRRHIRQFEDDFRTSLHSGFAKAVFEFVSDDRNGDRR